MVAWFVERIRASEHFIPELALVAEDSAGVIAHVMLSWVGVGRRILHKDPQVSRHLRANRRRGSHPPADRPRR
jgi:hypothetical protein